MVADVVIVGGGLTGAVVAWKFAKAGVRVVVLEARRVGQGSTAANSALLMHEPDRDLGELKEFFGSQAARRIWSLCRQATRDFTGTLRQLNIDCDLAEREAIYFTMNKDAVRRLHAEHRRRRSAGFGGRWLDAGELRRLTGIRRAFNRGGMRNSTRTERVSDCCGQRRDKARMCSSARRFVVSNAPAQRSRR
jgi:glycine/D-amino acid oxidase-like deaminating enzyme